MCTNGKIYAYTTEQHTYNEASQVCQDKSLRFANFEGMDVTKIEQLFRECDLFSVIVGTFLVQSEYIATLLILRYITHK